MERTSLGITPACAGKSKLHHIFGLIARDHPRVCGEKYTANATETTELGSPPRVRGKAVLDEKGGEKYGITPACAGKSMEYSASFRTARDHPRVCGEKMQILIGSGMDWGSPPRVRGKDYRDVLQL